VPLGLFFERFCSALFLAPLSESPIAMACFLLLTFAGAPAFERADCLLHGAPPLALLGIFSLLGFLRLCSPVQRFPPAAINWNSFFVEGSFSS
jgi:hypothetical protein